VVSNKAVFLDRDGTIIVDKCYLNDPDQIEYFPGVFDALKALSDKGYKLFIVTNQSGIARGIVDPKNLEEIHRRIANAYAEYGVKFDAFYSAPYSVESNHFERKPNPGMLEKGAKEHSVDLSQSWMVGDRMTDVEAGHRAGAKSILLEGVETPEDSSFEAPTAFVKDLVAAVDFIIKFD
jgi:D-glycero-D-manno-heptose 1,7-bisphosphate phosphatase